VVTLVSIGALTPCEQLTPLGQLLTKLPVDVRLGKLILYGVCFGAADEALTIAAALTSRSPFLSPMERREQADESKRQFTLLQSDHLAVLNAYSQFDALRHDERYSFARDRFLGIKTLQQIGQLKRQLLESLSYAGVRHAPPARPARSAPPAPCVTRGGLRTGRLCRPGCGRGASRRPGERTARTACGAPSTRARGPRRSCWRGCSARGSGPTSRSCTRPRPRRARPPRSTCASRRARPTTSPRTPRHAPSRARSRGRRRGCGGGRGWGGAVVGRRGGGWRRRQKGRDGTAPPGPR